MAKKKECSCHINKNRIHIAFHRIKINCFENLIWNSVPGHKSRMENIPGAWVSLPSRTQALLSFPLPTVLHTLVLPLFGVPSRPSLVALWLRALTHVAPWGCRARHTVELESARWSSNPTSHH